MDLSVCLYLSPLDIFYSQDTIAATFQDGRKIGRTLDALVNMETFVTDIPPITVVKQGDKYFSRNNRRLWVFKHLSMMGQCEYIPTILSAHLPSNQFTTEIDGHEIHVRGENGSFRLKCFKESKRQKTLETIKASRLGPLTPRFRYKFSPRFKSAYSHDVNAKKRRILRAKRRLKMPREKNTDVEATGFDFDQYAIITAPRIAFTSEKNMVFGKEHVVNAASQHGSCKTDTIDSVSREGGPDDDRTIGNVAPDGSIGNPTGEHKMVEFNIEQPVNVTTHIVMDVSSTPVTDKTDKNQPSSGPGLDSHVRPSCVKNTNTCGEDEINKIYQPENKRAKKWHVKFDFTDEHSELEDGINNSKNSDVNSNKAVKYDDKNKGKYSDSPVHISNTKLRPISNAMNNPDKNTARKWHIKFNVTNEQHEFEESSNSKTTDSFNRIALRNNDENKEKGFNIPVHISSPELNIPVHSSNPDLYSLSTASWLLPCYNETDGMADFSRQ